MLGSQSPRRRRILEDLGLRFEIRPAMVDETPSPGLEPAPAVEELAVRKAVAVNRSARECVLAADTLVFLDGRALGKPGDRDEARAMLRDLSGSEHCVISAVAVVNGNGRRYVGHEVTRISMRTFSDAEIEAYVSSGECDGKAGAYAIQESGDRFVDTLLGGLSNVIGLPVGLTLDLLRLSGFEIEPR